MADKSLMFVFGANTNKFFSELRKVERGLRGLNQLAAGVTSIGKTMTKGLTLPIIGAGLAVGKLSIDFESAFAGVRKTVDATDEELTQLRQGIRDMAKELPASTTEIAGVAEAAGQLGIETENILSFTRVMIDLGETTNLQATDAATALARLANITQMPQDQFDRLGSTVVELGNNLATTEAEIVEMGLRLAGAGSQVGMTEAEILGFAGALSSVGIEAQAGGTAISRVMVDMANEVASGGKKLELFAKVAGMTTKDFQTAFKEDAAGALTTFIEGLGRVSDSGQNVFAVLDALGMSEVRVRDALLRASGAGDLFRRSIELGNKAWKENLALTKESQLRYETTAAKLGILWNRLKDVGITLGDVLVPALMDALDATEPLLRMIEKGAKWFANLDKSTQRWIVTTVGIVAALGPVLVVLGTLASSLLKINSLLLAIGRSSAVASVGIKSVGLASAGTAASVKVLILLLGKLALAAAAIGAVFLVVRQSYRNLQKDLQQTAKLQQEVTEALGQDAAAVKRRNDAISAITGAKFDGQKEWQEDMLTKSTFSPADLDRYIKNNQQGIDQIKQLNTQLNTQLNQPLVDIDDLFDSSLGSAGTGGGGLVDGIKRSFDGMAWLFTLHADKFQRSLQTLPGLNATQNITSLSKSEQRTTVDVNLNITGSGAALNEVDNDKVALLADAVGEKIAAILGGAYGRMTVNPIAGGG